LGRLDVVKLLVARGADVNARAWNTTEESVEVIERPGNVREVHVHLKVKPDGKGEWHTPLGMARRGPPGVSPGIEHDAVVEFLVASGARE